MVKFGVRNGFQRYQCRVCKRTRSDIPENPLVNLRVPFEKAAQVAALLVEGNGVRSCERLTQLNRRTVLGVLRVAGEKCAELLDRKIRNVKAEYVQADELACFVKTKEQNTMQGDLEHGQFFTFLSVDMFSKLIIGWRVDKRTREAAEAFMLDLKARVPTRFQLSTDAWQVYRKDTGAVRQVFGNEIDYATEQKIFSTRKPIGAARFFPLRLSGIKKSRCIGFPYMKLITTSHCERTNLTVRLFNRRFTRCTLGYSKTLENLRHAVALFVAHFNFCRVHSALGMTPAQAAGLTDHTWTIAELLSTH
ncbi:MAG: IS1 family transposase [Verrucomicrobiia bacterium]